MDGARPRIDPEELLANAGWLRALARGLVADGHRADDVVQQTFVAAVEHPPRADVPLRPWLARVARNFSVKVLRGEGRRALHEAAARSPAPLPSPAESVARTEVFRDVVDAVLVLEPIYRDVVVLRFFDGLDMADVARRAGVPLDTARTRLKRALAMLRDRLDREHGDRRAWALLLVGRPRASAPRVAKPVAATVVVGGVLVMKKILAVAIVVVLLSVGWFALRPRDEKTTATPMVASAAEAAPTKSPATRVHPATAATPPSPKPDQAPAGPHATGRVVDPAGSPVAGAVVVSMPDVEWWSGKSKENRETKTNADGRFDVALADVAPTFRLLADAAGFGLAPAKTARSGDDVTLTLTAGGALTGSVTDLDGKPIPGARVRWIGLLGEGALLVRETTASADGAYRLDGLPSASAWQGLGNSYDSRLAASAEGFAPLSVQWSPGDGASKFDLRLVRGAVLVGRVTEGETGKSVADARVLISSYEYPEPCGAGLRASSMSRLLAEVRSDADGRFRVEHIPASGFHPLRVNARGRRGEMVGRAVALAPGFAPGDDEIPVPADGATIDADIKLWPTASVTGRVVDTNGRSLAGIEVYELTIERLAASVPSQITGVPPRAVRTGADGRYRLDGVRVPRAAPAKTHVYATSDGLRRAMRGSGGSAELDVKAGDVAEAPDIVFAPDVATCRVVVTDQGGRPIWGARASFDQFRVDARSDRDGKLEFHCTYYIAGNPPKPIVLVVRADGFAPAVTPEFTPSKSDPPEVRVALGPAHRVSGRVVRVDGTAAAGALIDVVNAAVPLDAMFPASGVPLGVGSPPGPQFPRLVYYAIAKADDAGVFDIGDLPEGPYSLRVMGPPGPGIATATDVANDARDLVFTLPALTPPAASGSLEIVVTDASTGAPVAHPTAALWGGAPPTSPPCDASDVPGLLKWHELPSGKWTARVTADGYVGTERDVDVVAGEPTRVTLPLAPGATVRGTVSVADGLERRDLRVCLFQPSGGAGPLATVVDASGAFELSGLAAGRWRVEVARPNPGNPKYATDVLVEVDLAVGSAARLELRVVLTGTIAVQVDGAAKALAESERGRYRVLDDDGREIATGRITYVGYDHFAYVRPGAYDVVVEMPGRETVRRRVTVASGVQVSAKF